MSKATFNRAALPISADGGVALVQLDGGVASGELVVEVPGRAIMTKRVEASAQADRVRDPRGAPQHKCPVGPVVEPVNTNLGRGASSSSTVSGDRPPCRSLEPLRKCQLAPAAWRGKARGDVVVPIRARIAVVVERGNELGIARRATHSSARVGSEAFPLPGPRACPNVVGPPSNLPNCLSLKYIEHSIQKLVRMPGRAAGVVLKVVVTHRESWDNARLRGTSQGIKILHPYPVSASV
jgi:hypothetical protein